MLKSILLFILLALITITIIGVLFVNYAPQFGADHSDAHKLKMTGAPQYNSGVFTNQIVTNTSGSDSSSMLEIIYKYIKGVPNQSPSKNIEVLKLEPSALTLSDKPNLVWFGHSSFLLTTPKLTLFFDPVFSNKASPHPWLGSSRYNKELPLTPEQVPEIDAIVISHDHYDHLDYDSILKLDHKVHSYYVPRGVASHLESWGIAKEKILEFDWWQNKTINEATLTFTPARHFSGRRITNQNQTLWGGWYINVGVQSIFFSGDTGYGPHFNEIREKLGAPDFALLECGQYNEAWADIHMMPEQTVQAALDLQADIMMPVHWGSFTLSLHTWTDPVERVLAEANKLQQTVVTPEIGAVVKLSQQPIVTEPWWTRY